jgi:Zn-dependent protease
MNGRKTYSSFQDIPFDHDAPVGSTRTGMGFSRIEIAHILIAVAVLTLSFSFAFVDYPPFNHLDQIISVLPFSFIAIITAFLCHEMAHKYVGQRMGYWSEFRMYPLGLVLSLLSGLLFGVVFAAPGAVEISGNADQNEMGKISLSGPLTNVVLGFLFFNLSMVSSDLIGTICFYLAYINIYLAVFNLIPFGPLDGAKVFRWNKAVWGILFGISVLVLLFLLKIISY